MGRTLLFSFLLVAGGILAAPARPAPVANDPAPTPDEKPADRPGLVPGNPSSGEREPTATDSRSNVAPEPGRFGNETREELKSQRESLTESHQRLMTPQQGQGESNGRTSGLNKPAAETPVEEPASDRAKESGEKAPVVATFMGTLRSKMTDRTTSYRCTSNASSRTAFAAARSPIPRTIPAD